MVQRFLRKNDVQASSEMLLFDCLNILETRKDLKDLWEKTNDLFKGANIADFLAHGNPILQTIGNILREEDLPSEFIGNIMELIKDVDAMRALSEMWVKTKLCKESKFLAAVESDEQDEHMDLRKRIKKCSRWKEYASLLPLKR
ncbi:hypothetical protein JTE90_016894 [Oedothorax gibbosus]|uniref:Uncharacterized protein n=1 Tax=Oedothorax gibbosus TaxID=931172 RepID=A0AAV6TLJ1_9ARAC|nr:hypothetical protein JTE90_016894 [Oedothorax gibbosus]